MPRRLLPLLTLLLLTAVPAPARAADPGAVQARIESGEDLAERARRVLQRARLRLDDGDWEGARAVLDGWLDGHPDRDHALLRFTRALARLAGEEPAAAREDLRAAVALEPDFARAWLRLGEAAYGLQDYAEAAAAFERAFALGAAPRPELLYYAAAARLLGEEPAAALALARRLLDLRPREAPLDWYRVLVAAAAAAGDTLTAGPALDRLLAERPASAEAWELAWRHAAGRGDHRQAAVLLTVVGALRPLTAAEHLQLADLYAAIGVPLQAARHYEQALAPGEAAADEPPPADLEERLAGAWLAAHRPERARQVLQNALSRRPDAALQALLGDLEYAAGNYEPARAAYLAACALDPDFGRGWLMAGWCAWELGRPAVARADLLRAAEFPAQAAAARSLLERTGGP